MSFATVTNANLGSGDAAAGFEIYVNPPPPDDVLPTVWLDLHVSGTRYEYCENEKVWHEFKQGENDERYVKIKPGRAVRIYTAESIGTSRDHAAVVVNVVGKIKDGLIIAPGKVDPGFGPHKLLLVIFNQSRRTYILKAGDVIASIAFSKLPTAAKGTLSQGFDKTSSHYEPTRKEKLKDWYSGVDLPKIIVTVLVAVAITFVFAYFLLLIPTFAG